MVVSSVSVFGSQCINYSAFEKVCLTLGRVVDAKMNPSAKIPAYLIDLVFSPELMEEHASLTGKRTYVSSAQLVSNHTCEDLITTTVLATLNFPRKQIGKVMSDCLVTGVQALLSLPDERRGTTLFVKPSADVALGSRVGILAQAQIIKRNLRDLEWADFARLDLRIGKIKGIEVLDREFHETFIKVRFLMDFGLTSRVACMGLFQSTVKLTSLFEKEVLVLTNLNPVEVRGIFELDDDSDISSVVCTIGGREVLEPAKPGAKGFRLA